MLAAQSCPTLCDPMVCSLPGSFVHGESPLWDFTGKNIGVGCHFLFQGTSRLRDWTQVSCIAGKVFTLWVTREGMGHRLQYSWASLVAWLVKNLPAMQETWVQSLGWEDPLRREWLPTPVFWSGEFHGLYSSWGLKESDTTEQLSLSLWCYLLVYVQ